jgi:hypothetical protein
VCSGLLVGVLVQQQHAAGAQLRGRGDFLLNLPHHRLPRPGRFGDKVLDALPVILGVNEAPGHVGKVALGFHRQQTAQVDLAALSAAERSRRGRSAQGATA